MVVSLNNTSVIVLWAAVIIPGHPIDSYTVVYSPVSQRRKRQEEKEEMVFPGTVTSAVITDWSGLISQLPVPGVCHCHSQWPGTGGREKHFYWFRMFIYPLHVTEKGVTSDSESGGCASSSFPIIAGVVIGVAVGVFGLIAARVMYGRTR